MSMVTHWTRRCQTFHLFIVSKINRLTLCCHLTFTFNHSVNSRFFCLLLFFSSHCSIPKVDKLEGALSLNNKLDNLELWHKGELFGPESFREYKGDLYTTLNGGDVVKLSGNHITPVVKFGKPCKGFHEESKCGRPLGMDFDASGILYVCDAYYGVFKVNPETGNY